MCINKPHWQSSGIIIFLFKCYIVISYTLVNFFLDVLFLLLAVILSELYENPRRKKDWVAERGAKKNLCEGDHFFDCMPSLLCFFCCFLRLLSFPSDVLAVWPQWKYIIFLWVENLLEFNNSWLASPGMWSYFRLFLASVILAMTLN